MKRIVNCSLLILLALGGSCKKPLDVVEVGEPPLPPEGCRIVKTYYKTPTIGLQKNEIVGAETITLDDGSKVKVSLAWTTTYKYDQQGRIIETYRKVSVDPKAYDITRLTYETNRLDYRYESFSSSSATAHTGGETIWLDEQGLRTYFTQSGQSIYTYNADWQLLSRYLDRPNTHTYQNGNLIEAMFGYPTWVQKGGQWVPIDYQLRRYEYNLSRPKLPVVYQYDGSGSRNLLTKEVWEIVGSSEFPDGPVQQKTYAYVYNKQGLVKRQIVHSTQLHSGWLLMDELYGVGVSDYEYECP